MEQTHSFLRAAKHFLFGTALSRMSGLMRDIAMAFCFGSSPQVALFMVAYRFANLFRRFFGEGNMAAGFIPAYEHRRAECEQSARYFYRDAAWSTAIFLCAIAGAFELVLWGCAKLLPSPWNEIASLAMWMAPGLIFICLFGLHCALLQSQKKTFWSGAAPAAFNLAWIAIAFLSAKASSPMQLLSLGIAIAYAAQWSLTAYQVSRAGLSWGEWMRPSLFGPEWRSILKPISLGILGVGATQINSALDALFATAADPSGPAYLWYAIRVEQLPVALFGVAISGALLPPLSRAIKEGEMERYFYLLGGAIRHVLALLIPCTFGFFALGRSGLSLLFGHGGFGADDVAETTLCLWAYGIGLIPTVLVMILAQGYYAKKSYLVPTRASLSSVIANLLLNGWLVFGLGWGATSVALATSASAAVNLWILSRSLQISFRPYLGFALRIGLICAAAAGASLWAQNAMGWGGRFLGFQIVHFAVGFSLFAGIFLLASWKMGITEVFELFLTRSQRRN